MEKNTALTAITDLRMEAEDLSSRTNRAVQTALDLGASWTAIGKALGVSKQTAHARYAKKLEDLPLSDPAFDPLFAAPEPSIFSDAPAPAKGKNPSKKVDRPAPAKVDDPIHQGITDTGGTPIDWTDRLGELSPKKCPFCEEKTHYSPRSMHWWIYPACTLTTGDRAVRTTHTNIQKAMTK